MTTVTTGRAATPLPYRLRTYVRSGGSDLARIVHPIGEGRGESLQSSGFRVKIIDIIYKTARSRPEAQSNRCSTLGELASACPPDPPPEGGRGVRTRICIDNYSGCVPSPGFVDCGSTFLCVFANCGQFVSDVCI